MKSLKSKCSFLSSEKYQLIMFVGGVLNMHNYSQVIVPKLRGEALGIVVVESGWGSMVPTVVLANMSPTGAAARYGHLNIGDQIISINGISLVGLPLSTCQSYIKVGIFGNNISVSMKSLSWRS